MNNRDIKPIETRYAGCRFRSRLEARWAVFFDHLGIEWDYEPQGYDLPSGPYLPDFWLPQVASSSQGVWFEIKSADDDSSDERWFELVGATRQPLVIARGLGRGGDEPDIEAIDPCEPDPTFSPLGACWDNCRLFCVCLQCRLIGVAFDGRVGRLPCGCGGDNERDRGEMPWILAAYTAARSARFEHGEAG